MPEKRKDSKGRVLKDGESQRANGTYDYRYTDIHKKRRCIYAKSLTELRKKEEELWRDLADGIDYAAGEMTVADLVDRYMNLKRGLKPNSLRSYNTAVKRIHADPFGQKAIKTVKLSDAKGWFVFLHDSGFKQNTIGILQSVVRPAFEMAVEDDIIRKNPFKFKLSDVVPKDAYVRDALTREQQEKYLQFVRDYGGNYYDDIVILMGTGLRVSELYGLTRADIDFERHCIHVRRQLCRTPSQTFPERHAYSFPSALPPSAFRTCPEREIRCNHLPALPLSWTLWLLLHAATLHKRYLSWEHCGYRFLFSAV